MHTMSRSACTSRSLHSGFSWSSSRALVMRSGDSEQTYLGRSGKNSLSDRDPADGLVLVQSLSPDMMWQESERPRWAAPSPGSGAPEPKRPPGSAGPGPAPLGARRAGSGPPRAAAGRGAGPGGSRWRAEAGRGLLGRLPRPLPQQGQPGSRPVRV